MHHIILKHLMHCIILILAHLSARLRPRGAKIRNSSEASPKEHAGPQATSYMDTNIIVLKVSPDVFNQYPCLLF
jgi:hypothetical protein